MWHTIFVAAHAITATSALATGIFTLLRSRLLGLYLGSLVSMEVFLVLAVATQWSAYTGPTRAGFATLTALGGIVVWQGLRAWTVRPLADKSPSRHYYEHLGFTLVALVDAFLVITVLNAGAPGWTVATTGALIAASGHFALRISRPWIITEARHPTTPTDADSRTTHPSRAR